MSNAKGYISSLEDLQFHFEKIGDSYWNLFRGFHSSGRTPLRDLIYRQEEEMSVEDSWELLSQMLEQNSRFGGKFTIHIHDNGTKKGSYLWAGFNLMTGNSRLSGFQQQYGALPVDEVERRITDAIEKERMSREIEDLKAAISGQMNPWQQLGQRFIEDLDVNRVVDSIQGLITGFMQGMAASRTPVTLQGTPEEMAAAAIDPNRVAASVASIRAYFPNDEQFYYFLDWVVSQFQANPGMYLQLAGLNQQANGMQKTNTGDMGTDKADNG